jgi:galactokinase/mevalonate kinase-like predicted kinase
VLRSIRQKYLEKDIQTLKVLNQIRLNARAGFKLLEEGRFLDFCKTMTDSWDMVNEVETKSAVEPIKILRKFCRKDLVGNKMAGAGGGGFVLAFFKDEEARGYYFKKLKDVLPNARFYHHLFGEEGLELRQGNKLLKVGKLRQI